MNLIERLNNAIDLEYDAKNQEVDELRLLPIQERVLKGETIQNVTASFIKINVAYPNGNGRTAFKNVNVKCNNNISKFKEGSQVILSGHGYSFHLEVSKDNGDVMELQVSWQFRDIDSNLINSTGWQLDTDKVDIREVVKKSTSYLLNHSEKLQLVTGIFEGSVLPLIYPQKYISGKQISEQTKLNSTQKEAFTNAYASENYYLIQGPPGTGKTWLIAHLANQFAKEGKKVLITACTHTAINNALQMTSVLSDTLPVIKVGKKIQSQNLNRGGSTARNVEDFNISGYSNQTTGIVVGATCYAPFTNKLQFMEWDVVILDEAGQLNIPLGVAAMVKGQKYIFVGDHKQLPPIVPSNLKDQVFSKSIFEHLFEFTNGTILDITYRMNAAINQFPSINFYDGKLHPHESNKDSILMIDNTFTSHQNILDVHKPEILYCHNHKSDYSRSDFEANLIAELVGQYLSKGIDPKQIAIITPFRAQVRQIKTTFLKFEWYNIIKESLFIDTIESIQGQERDVVLFSLVISDPILAKQRADFFFSPNRLNVALTRSKKKRIVIANKQLFQINTYDTKLSSLVKKFKNFYDCSTKIFE